MTVKIGGVRRTGARVGGACPVLRESVYSVKEQKFVVRGRELVISRYNLVAISSGGPR